MALGNSALDGSRDEFVDREQAGSAQFNVLAEPARCERDGDQFHAPETRATSSSPDTFSVVTLELGPDDKRMKLRYAGTCRLCETALPSGADAIYERTLKAVRCVECHAETNVPQAGAAGASARREFERRKDHREQRIRDNHPKLGGLILALSDEPQSTRAWERGAIGEELMAQRLEDLPDTFRVLHDRRIPRSRANIDHIVVGPSGVWVIDAKRYKDQRPTLQIEGGILRPRVESLRIGRRDGTKLVDGIRSQVERVVATLEDSDVSVIGVLCFLQADWPLIGGSFTVSGIDVTWPRALIKQMVERPGDGLDVDAIYTRLATTFPPA